MAAVVKNNISLSARVGVSLFGLIFLVAGAAFAYFLVLPDLRDWLAARQYVPVPATLLGVELEQHAGQKSTTYNLRAAYRYTFGGRPFVSERVAVSDKPDNLGDFHQRLYARLNASRERGGAVTAWVDPSDPHRALLDRDMRWDLFAFKSAFALVFALAGGGVMLLGGRARSLAAATEPAAIPRQPSGRVISSLRTTMRFWWGFAIFWNLVTAPMLFLLPRELAKGNWPALAILIFTVAGIWMLYQAVHATAQWRRFGALALTLAPYPGSIGGAVAGSVELPERFPPADVFRVTITCVRSVTTGTGRNRRTSETALWQDETRAVADAGVRGTRLSFGFTVPAGLPQSSAPSGDYVVWRISLAADLPGVDLDTRFDVPMIPLAPGAAPAAGAPIAVAPEEAPAISPRIVRIGHAGGATVFYYPLFRYPAMGVSLLMFALFFSVPVVFMAQKAHGGMLDVMLWFMMAAFGLVGSLLFLAGLYVLGNTLRVEISPRGLTAVRRIYGVPFTCHARLGEITAVETKIAEQSNNGGKISIRYGLIARTSDGRNIAVGSDIPGRASADHLARLVREACGLHG